MDYIRELNAFTKLLKFHYIPVAAERLWLHLLFYFNELQWVEYVQLNTSKIKEIGRFGRNKTFIEARDFLVDVGLLAYYKQENKPTIYRLGSAISVLEFVKNRNAEAARGETPTPAPIPGYHYNSDGEIVFDTTDGAANVAKAAAEAPDVADEPEYTPPADAYPYAGCEDTGLDGIRTSDVINAANAPATAPAVRKAPEFETYDDTRFNEFYEKYPRKKDKKRAYAVWKDVVGEDDNKWRYIMASLRRWKKFEGWNKDRVDKETGKVTPLGYVSEPKTFLEEHQYMVKPSWNWRKKVKALLERKEKGLPNPPYVPASPREFDDDIDDTPPYGYD